VTPEEAEQRLLSLELFGMRFGLDRMRRLMTALGHPERSFRSKKKSNLLYSIQEPRAHGK